MRYKPLLLGIIFAMILTLVTGCQSHNELGNLSIVTGFFLEQSSDGYLLVADCIDFLEQEHNSFPKTKPVTVTAPTLSEAFAKLSTQSETPLYFERAKIFVLGNSILESTATDIIKELFAKRIVRSDISLLQTKISSKTIYQDNFRPFGLPLDNQLKKENHSHKTKLYQLIKEPEKIRAIPTVFLSENGFYLQ